MGSNRTKTIGDVRKSILYSYNYFGASSKYVISSI